MTDDAKRIVVLVKQVPEPGKVAVDRKSGKLNFEKADRIINPTDKNAIEVAMQIKATDPTGYIVTAMTMGHAVAEDALREALAMGADEALLLSDSAFDEADAWTTATILASGLRSLTNILVISGAHGADSHGAQVGPYIAHLLERPQATMVQAVTIPDEDDPDSIEVRRRTDEGYERLEVPLPAVLTVDSTANKPRYPSASGIYDAYHEREVNVWSLENLDLDDDFNAEDSVRIAYKGLSKVEEESTGEVLKDEPVANLVGTVIKRLQNKNLIERGG